MQTLIKAIIAILLTASLSWSEITTIIVGQPTVAAVTNGEVGNKSGANDYNVTPTNYPGNDQSLIGCFSAITTGSISYIHARINYSSGTTGQQYNAGIYTSGGSLISDSTMRDEPGTVPGIISFQLDSPITVTLGTIYCLAIAANNSPDSWNISTTNAPGQAIYTDETFDVSNTLPSTMEISTIKNNNEQMRIWATNTSDGS